MGNDILIDTEKKIKSILQRYYEVCNSIEILEGQVNLLEEMLHSDDLTSLLDRKDGDGRYNNDSVVVKEAIFNEQIEIAIEFKRKEIKADITRIKTAISIKKSVINDINKILKSRELNQDQKELIQLCYIDKKYNKDSYTDIINKFNQGKKIIYSTTRIEQIRNYAITIIARKFIKINFLLNQV